MSLWNEVPIHVIDFEGHRDYGIVEYGVVTLLGGGLSEAETRLCRASRNLRPEEVRLHGISHHDTADFPPFTDEWSRFSGLRQTGVLGAHHASFENFLLKSVWPYPNFSPDFLSVGKSVADWGPWVDTRVLYESKYPDLPSYRLSDLVVAFELSRWLDDLTRRYCPPDRSRYHCALYDALACSVLLLKFMEAVANDGATIEWLLRKSMSRQSWAGGGTQGELFPK